jgi:hypothetical protein
MGGRPWLAKDEGERVTDVLFRYFPGNLKLAFCIFAQPEKDWEETRVWNTTMFNHFKGDRKIEYQTMTPENFADVSAWADVIYLPGGSAALLLEKLQAAGDLAKLWDGKVIAGSSAGADIFCEGFMYLQDKTYGKGLGWIKASCIPHWRADFENYTEKDWDWAEQEALRSRPDLPVLCIPEGDFVEFTV